MKKKIIVLIALLVTTIGFSAIVTNTAPSDQHVVATYDLSITRWDTVKELQDAAGKALILPFPGDHGYSESYLSSWVGNTQYVTITSVVVSAYAPISFDTTLWPYADANGIRYNMCVITNPLIAKTSNFWINALGTSNGWKLVQ